MNLDLLEIPDADWICAIGIRPDFYEKFRSKLDEDNKKRLLFIDVDGSGAAFDHLQCQVYPARTDEEFIETAKKIGWKAVFRTTAVLDFTNREEEALQFEKVLTEHKEAAFLLLSDWADGGESVMRHAFAIWNSIPDVRSALDMKDCFRGIPAVICGAGPSLQKNSHLLDPEKALIFAGGTALDRIPVEPHFAASIDREGPFEKFKRQPFWQTSFLYQSRMNPKNFALLHGEKFYVPDGCHPAETWLSDEDLFDGGWTVGTYLAAVALHFGCDPIVYVGMDFCYDHDRKYAFSDASFDTKNLIETQDRSGKKVYTQRDWLMAAHWISDLAVKRWDRTFINATEGGLGFGSKVAEKNLKEMFDSWDAKVDLTGRVHAETMIRDFMQIPLARMDLWKKSLKRCLKLCKKTLKKPDNSKWEEEIVYQKLLFPLWKIWGPIFERELEIDPQPIPMEEKLRLNQILFFEQVLNEQTN